MANMNERRRAIIDRCRGASRHEAELANAMRASQRSIDGDRACLRRTFPRQLRAERGLDGLLERLGLEEEARAIAPEAVQVSRFAARGEDPATLEERYRALVGGRALRCVYSNNDRQRHEVHCRPVRLVNIHGEWHLIAWAREQAAGVAAALTKTPGAARSRACGDGR